MTTVAMPIAIGVALFASWGLPRWLPPAVLRLREWIFTRVNGAEGIPVPGPLVDAEHFERVYAHPAANGRSAGAGLSDLFWYWLAPGPQLHQEHLEQGERYTIVARTTRKILAVPHRRSTELATEVARRILDTLPSGRTSLVRLRDLMMPIWAEVYYELVFGGRCPADIRDMIVANASDVVNALKCTRLRHLDRRDRLTRYLVDRVAAGTAPVTLPAPFTSRETAWYLQGTFFNTAVVQMSEAMTHLLLAIAEHPGVQREVVSSVDERSRTTGAAVGGATGRATDGAKSRTVGGAKGRATDGGTDDSMPAVTDDALNRTIDETLRVYPLFGVAHRITSAPIAVGNGVTLPSGSVLLFNYQAFHHTGPAADPDFNPDRWLTLSRASAHFVPYGITANRACPARGVAPVMMRAVAREVLSRYTLASSVSHSRSLPSRGPCYLTPSGAVPPGPARLWVMRLMDRWAEVGRGVTQLFLGSWMVIDARRQRLCATYFEEVRNDSR